MVKYKGCEIEKVKMWYDYFYSISGDVEKRANQKPYISTLLSAKRYITDNNNNEYRGASDTSSKSVFLKNLKKGDKFRVIDDNYLLHQQDIYRMDTLLFYFGKSVKSTFLHKSKKVKTDFNVWELVDNKIIVKVD